MKQKLSFKEVLLFAEAWTLMACARLLLVFFPFKKIVKLMGKPIGKINTEVLGGMPIKYKPLNIAIERASRHSFWRAKCFEQAITAKWMLKRRKKVTAIFFGVKKEASEKLTAHAWLVCEGEMITGGKTASSFHVISCFEE